MPGAIVAPLFAGVGMGALKVGPVGAGWPLLGALGWGSAPGAGSWPRTPPSQQSEPVQQGSQLGPGEKLLFGNMKLPQQPFMLMPSTQNGLKALYWLLDTQILQVEQQQQWPQQPNQPHAAAGCVAIPRPSRLRKAEARSLFMASILFGAKAPVPPSS